jgi:hypothetical protein
VYAHQENSTPLRIHASGVLLELDIELGLHHEFVAPRGARPFEAYQCAARASAGSAASQVVLLLPASLEA